MAKISIVIPALNEEKTIGILLKDIRKRYKNKYEIVVIDDGSTDKTAEIAKKYNVKLVQNKRKSGKGSALRKGFAAASGDILVMLDADLSHKPEDLPQLLAPMKDKKIGLVIASRALGGSEEYTFFRAIGNVSLTTLANLMLPVKAFDVLNGYKVLRKEIAKDLTCKGFEIEIQIVAHALKKGYEVVEVASQEKARADGHAKSSALKEGWKFFRLIVVEGVKYRF